MDLSSLQTCLFIFSILTFSLRRLKVLNKCSWVPWFSVESKYGWPWKGRREEEQEDLGIVFTCPPQITLGKFPELCSDLQNPLSVCLTPGPWDAVHPLSFVYI